LIRSPWLAILLALSLAAIILAMVPIAPASGAGHITPIYDIQGEGHISPEDGNSVVTQGVITAVGFRALYVQDPIGDGNDATSDAIFVFDFDWFLRDVGECVELSGNVSEFIPGGAATGNLSTTQMFAPSITIVDCEATFGPGYAFPEPVVIGLSGRIPPNEIVISEDETDPPINLQDAADDAANTFDPDEDGIDFYESMEAMLVMVEDAQAVSATRRFGTFSAEFFTVPNRADTGIIEPNGILYGSQPGRHGYHRTKRCHDAAWRHLASTRS